LKKLNITPGQRLSVKEPLHALSHRVGELVREVGPKADNDVAEAVSIDVPRGNRGANPITGGFASDAEPI
jgi:hypothetical protein